jgi:hypothetical protein
MRPEISDEMRDAAPKEATLRLTTVTKQARDNFGNPLFDGDGQPVMIERKLSRFEKGAAFYRRGAKRPSEATVTRGVRRREIMAAGGLRVDTLVSDPGFWATVNMEQYEGQVQADWPEIQAGGARESRAILDEALEQYEEATGITPQW